MCKMNILKALGIAVSLQSVLLTLCIESWVNVSSVKLELYVLVLQLNADCLDDLPLDYELALGGVGGVGGVGALALEAVVSGASSDGTLSEGSSSVVLDPGVRRVGLPQDYQDPDPLRDSPVTATTDTHTGVTHAHTHTCISLSGAFWAHCDPPLVWTLIQVSCSRWRAVPLWRP